MTDNDIEQIAGKRDKFIGLIQERYGIARDDAEREVDEWWRTHEDEEISHKVH